MTTTILTTLFGALCLCLLQAPAKSDQVATGADYNRLYEDLHTNKIHRHLVPVKKNSTKIHVFVGAALINFEGLDETNGILHLALWIRLLWRDQYMKWNPSEYGGITRFQMPHDSIWKPDIKLYNARGPAEVESVNVVVYNSGSILYFPQARTKSHCSVDLTYFPFDKQTCILKFGSWTYDATVVAGSSKETSYTELLKNSPVSCSTMTAVRWNSLSKSRLLEQRARLRLDYYEGYERIDLADYIQNQEWDIIGTSAEYKYYVYYPCCKENYPHIAYNLTIQRKTTYYTYVYVGPAVVLSLLAPFIFLLPPGDPQKMTLGVGLLVCFTLFFMAISTALPTMHGHAPLIDKYYMTVYVLLCVAMALSTLVSNLARRALSMRHPPEIIKTIMLNCLGRCLCVSGSMYDNQAAGDDSEAKEGVLKQSGNQVKEWMLIATVVDRLLFLVYLALTILLTIIILSCRG